MKRMGVLVSSSQAAAETAEKKGALQKKKIRAAEAVAQAERKVRRPWHVNITIRRILRSSNMHMYQLYPCSH